MTTVTTRRRLEARLLGCFDLRLGGEPVDLPSRSAQSLFAYLILSAGTRHRREKLAGMLWPEADEENARSYLRHALWRIRKGLGSATTPGGHLISDDISVGFARDADHWLDVARFDARRQRPIKAGGATA